MYTWKQKLTVDASAEKLLRTAVNAYSNEKKSHPYHNYGDKITIKDYWYNPIYLISLHTEFDRREVSEKVSLWHKADGEPDARTISSPGQVDPWKYGLHEPHSFVKAENTLVVPGSKFLVLCSTCRGAGKEICPTCNGEKEYKCHACTNGRAICHVCGGSGQKTETRTQTVYETVYRDYSSGRNYSMGGGGKVPVRIEKKVQKEVQVPCPSCTNGKVLCTVCNGRGKIKCRTCAQTGRIKCRTCEGSGKLLHYYEIHQTLSDDFQVRKWRDTTVPRVADIVEGASKGESVFSMEGQTLAHHLVPDDPTVDKALDELLTLHEGKVDGKGQRRLFQKAEVLRADAWVVTYTYNGKLYTGGIRNGQFIPETSPIIEYAEGLVASADKKVKGYGAVGARKILDAAEELDVKSNRMNISRLRQFIRKYINEIHDTGLQLTFWAMALFVTPLLINFYSSYNPVAKYLAFTNYPKWWGYHILPISQGVVFVFALWTILNVLKDRDHSREKVSTAGGFLAAGVGRYLLYSLAFLVVLLVLNYFGLAMVTLPVVLLVAAVIFLGFMLLSAIITLVLSLIALVIHIFM